MSDDFDGYLIEEEVNGFQYGTINFLSPEILKKQKREEVVSTDFNLL